VSALVLIAVLPYLLRQGTESVLNDALSPDLGPDPALAHVMPSITSFDASPTAKRPRARLTCHLAIRNSTTSSDYGCQFASNGSGVSAPA
jgi:hypothetical protein